MALIEAKDFLFAALILEPSLGNTIVGFVLTSGLLLETFVPRILERIAEQTPHNRSYSFVAEPWGRSQI